MPTQPPFSEILKFLGHASPTSRTHFLPGRTRVSAIAVTSLDGRGAMEGTSGGLGNTMDAEIFNTHRALSDVVFAGPGTIAAEEYGPVEITDSQMEIRQEQGRREHVVMATLSRSLDIDPSLPFFTAANGLAPEPIIFTAEISNVAKDDRDRFCERRKALVQAGANVVPLKEPSVYAALGELGARGYCDISFEGGPTMYAEALRLDCVDELLLTVSPFWVGAGPTTFGQTPAADDEKRKVRPREFTLADALIDDSHTFLRYFRQR